ncbi:MAG: hypothetical protein LBE01_01015 [Deltaproteobacteria bacterium]|jgi:hypothetical protein|nr:hypothetical protein [Deltaproteobacteria bacterium]
MSPTVPPDPIKLAAKLERLAREADNLQKNLLAIPPGDSRKERLRAKKRSAVAMSLLKAREHFEALAAAGRPGLTAQAALTLFRSHVAAGLPAEARHLYDNYLKPSQGVAAAASWPEGSTPPSPSRPDPDLATPAPTKPSLSPPPTPSPSPHLPPKRLLLTQLKLAEAFLKSGDFGQAEEILEDTDPADFSDDAALAKAMLFFAFVFHGFKENSTSTHASYLKFHAYLTQRAANRVSAVRPNLTLVESGEPSRALKGPKGARKAKSNDPDRAPDDLKGRPETGPDGQTLGAGSIQARLLSSLGQPLALGEGDPPKLGAKGAKGGQGSPEPGDPSTNGLKGMAELGITEAVARLASEFWKPKAIDPLGRGAAFLAILSEAVEDHLEGSKTLAQEEISFALEELLSLSALLTANYLGAKGDCDNLWSVSESLDFFPDSTLNLLWRAAILVGCLASLDAFKGRQMAEKLLDRLLALPSSPTLDALKAQGIIALTFRHRDDPTMAKALELRETLFSLPNSPEVERQKLKALGLLIAIGQAHGRLGLIRSLREEAFAINETVKDENIAAEILMTTLSAPPVPGQEEESLAAFEALAQLADSPKIALYKARAALTLISQSALMGQVDLAVRIFHRLSQIRDAGPFKPQLTHAVSTLLRSLAREGRHDQMELYLKALGPSERDDDYLAAARAETAIELVSHYLASDSPDKAQALAEKIDRSPGDDPTLLAAKAKLRLVFIQYYGARGDLARVEADFKLLRALGTDSPPVVQCQAAALAVMASMAGFAGNLPLAVARLERLAALAEDRPRIINDQFYRSLKNRLNLFVLIVSLAAGRIDAAQGFLGDLLSSPTLVFFPKLSVAAATVMGNFLAERGDLEEALALGERLSLILDQNLYREAIARLNLAVVKKLVAMGRVPQAEPCLNAIEEMTAGGPLLHLYAEGLALVGVAYVKAGRHSAKFRLARPARGQRDQSSGTDPKGQAPDSSYGRFWLEKLLALPDQPQVKIRQKAAVHKVVLALIDKAQPREALKVFRLPTSPLPADGYELAKLHLNSAFALMEAFKTADPAMALALLEEVLALGLEAFLAKYYLRNLVSLGLSLKETLPAGSLKGLRQYLSSLKDPLAETYLKAALGPDYGQLTS